MTRKLTHAEKVGRSLLRNNHKRRESEREEIKERYNIDGLPLLGKPEKRYKVTGMSKARLDKVTREQKAMLLLESYNGTKIMEMILGGSSKRSIARELGMSLIEVDEFYTDALSALNERRMHISHLLKEKQMQELESIKELMREKMEKGSVPAGSVFLKALDQEAKLNGLYPKSGGNNTSGKQLVVVNVFGEQPQEDVIEGQLSEPTEVEGD